MSCRAFRREWQPDEPGAHAKSCGACAEWLAEQRDLSVALSRLKARLDAPPPSLREVELRAAFRGSHRSALRGPQLGRFVGLAAAAGFVGLIALFLRFPGSPDAGRRAQEPSIAPKQVAPSAKPRPSRDPKRPAHPAAPRTPSREPSVTAPVLQAGPPTEVAAAATPPPVSLSLASDVASQVAVADEDEAENEAEEARKRLASEQGFYPLVPDREPSAIESGQIVRVQLRPDVLTAAGIKTRPQGSAPVEAEVLMGPDGVALGIRLARPKR